jgi:hypothetical protein
MLRRQRKVPPPEDFNVNANNMARLVKLATQDLYDYAETSIMMAGYHLSQARTDPNGAHVEQAMEQCQFALEALRALTTR